MFPIQKGLKQNDASSPMLLNCYLEYAIKRARESQEGPKLNKTLQLLDYDDDDNAMGENVSGIKKKQNSFSRY
jgi:hypothetical protein